MKNIILAAAFGAMSSFGPPAGTPDYQRGYCDGFNHARDATLRNRDHYRRLLGQPSMSSEEVLAWIYSKPWKDDETHHTSPRRLDRPPGVPEVGPPAIESIDLYIMLPVKCEFQVG